MRHVLGMAVALLAAGLSHAQTDPAAGFKWPDSPWHTHQLTPHIYWIDGGGGNSGVIVGQHGVIVFDVKTTADSGRQLLQSIAKITPKPVTTVILSHSDVDHVGGLRAFPKGIRIIAQQNDLKELQADLVANPAQALPAADFPTHTVADHEDLTLDGIRMQLRHWAPAHTSGDLMLFLPQQKILFCGDIITENRAHPLIHLEKNGSSAGWITSVQGALQLDAVRFVPGHGEVRDRSAIQAMLDNTQRERAQIQSLVSQGQSLQQIEAATGDPSPEEKGGPPFAPFSEVVYRELTATRH